MYFLHILFIISFCYVTQADNSCLFEHSTYGVIDLRSLGLRNGQPRFRDISTNFNPNYNYSFNPCYSFTENECHNVAICQISSDRSLSFSLAIQNRSRWAIDSSTNTPVLTYTSGEKTVSISMICSYNIQDELEVLNEYPMNYYSMRLRSRCACWNGCKTPEPSSSTTTSKPTPWTTNVIYSSACMYHDSRYGTIDLSSIGSMNGIPAFKDMQSKYPNNYVWSYNPCYKFSEDFCQNVSGCQIDRARGISYTIGLQDHAYWINMHNNLTDNSIRSIVYPSTSINRRLTVQLICDQTLSSHNLQVLGETSTGEYTMQLTSACACWNGCSQQPSPQSYDWTFWAIAGGIGVVVFLSFCLMITCLFCAKPNRRHYPVMLVDEKTPIFAGKVNFHG